MSKLLSAAKMASSSIIKDNLIPDWYDMSIASRVLDNIICENNVVYYVEPESSNKITIQRLFEIHEGKSLDEPVNFALCKDRGDLDVRNIKCTTERLIDYQLSLMSESRILRKNIDTKYTDIMASYVNSICGSEYGRFRILHRGLYRIVVLISERGTIVEMPLCVYNYLINNNRVWDHMDSIYGATFSIDISRFISYIDSKREIKELINSIENLGYKSYGKLLQYLNIPTTWFDDCKNLQDVVNYVNGYISRYEHPIPEVINGGVTKENNYKTDKINFPTDVKGYESQRMYVAHIQGDTVVVKKDTHIFWEKLISEVDLTNLAHELDFYNAYGHTIGSEQRDDKILFLSNKMCEHYEIIHYNKVHILEERISSVLLYVEGWEHILRAPRIILVALRNNGQIASQGSIDEYGLVQKRTTLELINSIYPDIEDAKRIYYVDDIRPDDYPHDANDDWKRNHPFKYYLGYVRTKDEDKRREPINYNWKIKHPYFTGYELSIGKIEIITASYTSEFMIMSKLDIIHELVEELVRTYCTRFNRKRENISTGEIKYIDRSKVLIIPVIENSKEKEEPHVINPLWED